MATETVNALLVIADIGGYTRFMSLHRTSLAHAQENTDRCGRDRSGVLRFGSSTLNQNGAPHRLTPRRAHAPTRTVDQL